MTVPEFAQAVYTFATQFGGSCTSWGRTAARNALVGGVKGSPHVSWLGADIVYDDPLESTKETRAKTAKSLGLEVIEETDHTHLQPAGWINHEP